MRKHQESKKYQQLTISIPLCALSHPPQSIPSPKLLVSLPLSHLPAVPSSGFSELCIKIPNNAHFSRNDHIHLKNPIFTFNLLSISILTTPNANWGKKVGVIKNLCVYENGKGVEIENNHFHNTCCRCCCSVQHT